MPSYFFSPKHRTYLCFTSQMVLLGFLHDSSLFYSHPEQVNLWLRERDRVQLAEKEEEKAQRTT